MKRGNGMISGLPLSGPVSDYTPFLQHLGIASLNIGYGGENQGGSYHSIYDSFDHYTRFGDPDFDYGIALAQTTGRTVLRLANAELLPFEFENLTDNVAVYVTEITEMTDNMREETERENRLIREGTIRSLCRSHRYLRRATAEGSGALLEFCASAQLNRAVGGGGRELWPGPGRIRTVE